MNRNSPANAPLGRKTVSPAARVRFRNILQTAVADSKYFQRNGGNVAINCINSKCPSHHESKKLKLEVHLPTGLYSCWVCGLKGRLGPNERLTRALKSAELQRWLRENLPDLKSIESGPMGAALSDAQWSAIMREALREIRNEGRPEMGVDGEDSVEYHRLPETKLLSVPFEEQTVLERESWKGEAWKYWLKRWGSEAESNKPFEEAARLDVRIKPMVGGAPALAFPAWDSWGGLRGIHWWYPANKESSVDDLSQNAGKRFPAYRYEGNRQEMIIGESSIDWDRRVVLTEGIWDALRADRNAVPVMGKFLPKASRLMQMIIKRTPHEVVVALDADATAEAWALAELLSKSGINVTVAKLPADKDPADMDAPIDEWLKPEGIMRYNWASRLVEEIESI